MGEARPDGAEAVRIQAAEARQAASHLPTVPHESRRHRAARQGEPGLQGAPPGGYEVGDWIK